MAIEATNITKGAIGVKQYLAALGLDEDILRDAIIAGESDRVHCTPNDPPSFHGVVAWARSLRRLREILILKDWSRNDDGNYSTVVNPNGSMAIAVATGDKGTGLSDGNPKLKHPKGNMVRAAIARNVRYLFADMAKDAKAKLDKLEAAEKRMTWMLLKRRDKDTVFSELSLASRFSDGGQVERWQHRIILDPLDVEPMIDVRDDFDSGDMPIDVPVRRRS